MLIKGVVMCLEQRVVKQLSVGLSTLMCSILVNVD